MLQSLYPDSPALFAPRVSQKTTPEPRGIKNSVARSIPTLCSAGLIINILNGCCSRLFLRTPQTQSGVYPDCKDPLVCNTFIHCSLILCTSLARFVFGTHVEHTFSIDHVSHDGMDRPLFILLIGTTTYQCSSSLCVSGRV